MHFNYVEPIFCFSPSWTHSDAPWGWLQWLMAWWPQHLLFTDMVGDIRCVHFYSFFFWLCGMWDPSSLISNWTHALCFGSSESSKVFKVHWTFREVPTHTSRYPLLLLLIRNWSEVKLLSRVRLFATPSTVAYQASLSMGFPRQKWRIVCPQMPILLRSGHRAIGNLAEFCLEDPWYHHLEGVFPFKMVSVFRESASSFLLGGCKLSCQSFRCLMRQKNWNSFYSVVIVM